MRSGGGQKLGSSILDTEPKWRCEVCTFINRMTAEACGRCREPVGEEDRARLRLRVEKPAPAPKPGSRPRPAAAAAPAPAPAGRRAEGASGASKKQLSSPWPPAAAEGARKKAAPAKKKGKGIHTVQKKAATVRRTQFGGKHKGDLGYTPSKGSNVKSVTRSRLTEATASYAAKFEKEEGGAGKPRSGNIHTIGSGKVNGLTKSAAASRAEQVRREARNPHDEKRAPVPAKYRSGGSGRAAAGTGKRQTGLLARLQEAASSAAVASLKHTKRTVQPSVKTSHGQATKFAL